MGSHRVRWTPGCQEPNHWKSVLHVLCQLSLTGASRRSQAASGIVDEDEGQEKRRSKADKYKEKEELKKKRAADKELEDMTGRKKRKVRSRD